MRSDKLSFIFKKKFEDIDLDIFVKMKANLVHTSTKSSNEIKINNNKSAVSVLCRLFNYEWQ